MGFSFKGLNTTEAFSRNQYLAQGEHVVEIDQVICKSGFKGNSIIIEMKVVESSTEKDPVGSTRGCVFKLDKKEAWPAIKSFVIAAMGVDVTNKELVEAVCADPKLNPEATLEACEKDPAHLKGKRLRADVVPYTTKEKKEITVTNWRALS